MDRNINTNNESSENVVKFPTILAVATIITIGLCYGLTVISNARLGRPTNIIISKTQFEIRAGSLTIAA